MFQKILLCCVLAAFFYCQPAFAWFDKEVVDGNCTSQVLESVDISKRDLKNYERAFEYVKKGKFAQVDETAQKIENNILMGHLLAAKFLSFNYYANFEEMRAWLEEYSDHPQAPRIYSLASKRGDASALANPFGDKGRRHSSPYDWYNEDYEKISPKNAKYIRQQVNKFRKYLNSGKTRMARGILEDAKFRKIMPNKNYDDMSATLALVYFLDNEDKLAAEWSAKASKRSGTLTASWIAGLANWRQGAFSQAAEHFAKLGGQAKGDQWLISSGAFWAYRSHQMLENEQKAQEWLAKAAVYQRTFYGILANHKLGRSLNYDWDVKSYFNDFDKDDYVQDILTSKVMKRAIILIQIDNGNLAEQDLRYNYEGMSEKQQEIALYISKQYEMHSLGIFLSNCLRDYGQNRYYDSVAYPKPDWKPSMGWQVDKALALALVRQESAFQPMAKSGAGAIGLMQLMPRTALHVSRNSGIKSGSLTDVGHNLDMGQSYVNYLLEKPFIDRNMFFLTVAYNAGPGNLLKWQKKQRFNDDPLLYIETVPARETRLYIKRVMTNFWVYKMQFDDENSTLADVAEGKFPILPR